MRLFIAIPVPLALRKKVELLGKELVQDGITPVRAENMHATLKFIGECDLSQVERIKTKLESIKFTKFNCSIRSVGVFPNEDYVRVVWAGIESENKLEKLAELININLPNFGKDEPFSAHLTIARVKKTFNIHSFLSKHNDEEFGSFEVDRFELIESVLSSTGPTYKILAEFRFI